MEPQRPQLPEGYELARYGEVDSTNLEAARCAKSGDTGPLWIWADVQTAGRGRLGRTWVSEPGNLYASLLLSLDPGERAPDLSFIAALAVHSAAEACLPAESAANLKLKWPNDLLLNGEKSAGILIEQAGSGSVAIGCGLNLASVPVEDLRRPATGLALHGTDAKPQRAFEQLAITMDRWLKVWRREGFEHIRAAWLERAAGVGEMITASLEATTIEGRFSGLDPNGALLLEQADGEVTRILAADIELAA
ncbi:MAG: biotin--[acetyl-CoA-carboxylase] ligase [Alphaproteobacteria bacterium]|nr:biotin--[acetyl-CoA-carboxylase] ligase [Alphaproteobacteria bacterium]